MFPIGQGRFAAVPVGAAPSIYALQADGAGEPVTHGSIHFLGALGDNQGHSGIPEQLFSLWWAIDDLRAVRCGFVLDRLAVLADTRLIRLQLPALDLPAHRPDGDQQSRPTLVIGELGWQLIGRYRLVIPLPNAYIADGTARVQLLVVGVGKSVNGVDGQCVPPGVDSYQEQVLL